MKFPSFALFRIPVTPSAIGKATLLIGSISLGQYLLTDFIHIPGGELALLGAFGGFLWFSKSQNSIFQAPNTREGWVERCQSVLTQFEKLEISSGFPSKAQERLHEFNGVLNRENVQEIGFVSTENSYQQSYNLVRDSIKSKEGFIHHFSQPLGVAQNEWRWPETLFNKDIILYFLPIPFKAVDLIWLENIPIEQPSWIVINTQSSDSRKEDLQAFHSQLPTRWKNRIVKLDDNLEILKKSLFPIQQSLNDSTKNLDLTTQRLLARLHSKWQFDLEQLRRERFRGLQQRTQWLVAASVFASPMPSTDLIVLSVVNGMMANEMAEIWSSPLKPEALQALAKQLALAAVAQGVIEWSGNALLSASKLHGGTWIAAGTLQALSAAYLTRVVGRSMADWLALNNGVSEPDLKLIKIQAGELVSNAVEQERIDWMGFMKQAKSWIDNQNHEHSYLLPN